VELVDVVVLARTTKERRSREKQVSCMTLSTTGKRFHHADADGTRRPRQRRTTGH